MPALCPTTAKAAAQHPKMLEYAKRCKWTASTSPMNVATLLGTVMSLGCFSHLCPSSFK